MEKKFKLYKDGKFLVAGVIVATGMATTTAISHVNADTVSGDTAQAVQVTNDTQNSDKVQLPAPSQENNVVNQTAKADQTTKTDTTEMKSDVPTSVDNTTTQEQAKTAIDNAQDTVKSNVETAKQADVVVKEGETQQVTLDNSNAVSKTNEILSDLNKQDLAVQQATATQKANQEAYEKSQTNYDETVKQGQADLEQATTALDIQVEATKQAGIAVSVATSKLSPEYKDLSGLTVDVKTSQVNPNYQSVKGLTGKALTDAVQANINAYQNAVKQAVDQENGTAQSLQGQIDAYQKALSDYQAGLSVSTGLKWGYDTYVTGDNKMAGNEAVTSFADPSIKAAAMYAIQGNNLDQNTDANFDNIFKINGSGSVTIHNTTNGDVTITFSNINSPYNTGTYVAVWGADDGGIAFGVFATYSGRVQSGAGEAGGGSAGMAGSGAILNYVYSYDAEVSVTGNVSVATFNDIDNNQTVTMNGLDGQVTLGENIAQSGNEFSATAGDVSQGTSNVLDTNSVRWSLGKASPVSFNFHHMTSDRRNTSIVGGIFGADSDIPQEPQKPNLNAEKVSVAVPDSPEAPVAPKANVTKVTVDVLPEPVKPVAPKTNVTKVTVDVLPAPEAPASQEVDVHYYDVATTPETPEVPETPQAPTPEVPVVEKASLLPQTGAEENGHSSVLGALASVASLGLLGGVARKFKKQ